IVYGGQVNERERYIAPTILADVTPDDPIMRDEVFGPILSVMPVDDVQKDSIPFILSREKPLSLYIFSKNKEFINRVVDRTDAGGVTINDVVMHFACLLFFFLFFPQFSKQSNKQIKKVNGFPFGGTGASGVGAYHGEYSFKCFSHEKPVLFKYSGGEFLNDVRYPPFTEKKSNAYRIATEEKIGSSNKLATSAAIAGALGCNNLDFIFFLKWIHYALLLVNLKLHQLFYFISVEKHSAIILFYTFFSVHICFIFINKSITFQYKHYIQFQMQINNDGFFFNRLFHKNRVEMVFLYKRNRISILMEMCMWSTAIIKIQENAAITHNYLL
ncbi:fatty aldehyde dehydrogenase, partial [Reticulomyxa filosa]